MKNYHAIFGPHLMGVRCKKIRHGPDHVMIYFVTIPRDLLKNHKYVTLEDTVMFVKNIPFPITMYCGIRLITVEHFLACTTK